MYLLQHIHHQGTTKYVNHERSTMHDTEEEAILAGREALDGAMCSGFRVWNQVFEVDVKVDHQERSRKRGPRVQRVESKATAEPKVKRRSLACGFARALLRQADAWEG